MRHARTHPIGLAAAIVAAGALWTGSSSAQAPEARDTVRVAAPVIITARLDPADAAAEPGAHERVVAQGKLLGGGGGNDRVTVVLERSGTPAAAADDAWPVQTRWAVKAKDPKQSFVAELYGTASDDHETHLRGIISAGYRKGQEVHVDAPLGLKHQTTISIGTPREM